MNRYENVPISDKTKQGMTLTIDDLAAIGRLLTLQDNYYDEQFEKIFKAVDEVQKILVNHENRLCRLEKLFAAHIKDHPKKVA